MSILLVFFLKMIEKIKKIIKAKFNQYTTNIKFSELKTDIGAAILNEAAVKEFGLENPLDAYFQKREETNMIIGVVKDYHFKSLHNPIEPLLLRLYDPQWLFFVFVRITPENFSNTIQFLENKWKGHTHSIYKAFQVQATGRFFVRQKVDRLYQEADRASGVYHQIFGALYSPGSHIQPADSIVKRRDGHFYPQKPGHQQNNQGDYPCC